MAADDVDMLSLRLGALTLAPPAEACKGRAAAAAAAGRRASDAAVEEEPAALAPALPGHVVALVLVSLDLKSRSRALAVSRAWRDAGRDPLAWRAVVMRWAPTKGGCSVGSKKWDAYVRTASRRGAARLTDEALAAVIRRAGGGLKKLVLHGALNVSDRSLLFLHDQQNLEHVDLSGCRGLTGSGVRAVLPASVKALNLCGVSGVSRGLVGQLRQDGVDVTGAENFCSECDLVASRFEECDSCGDEYGVCCASTIIRTCECCMDKICQDCGSVCAACDDAYCTPCFEEGDVCSVCLDAFCCGCVDTTDSLEHCAHCDESPAVCRACWIDGDSGFLRCMACGGLMCPACAG